MSVASEEVRSPPPPPPRAHTHTRGMAGWLRLARRGGRPAAPSTVQSVHALSAAGPRRPGSRLLDGGAPLGRADLAASDRRRGGGERVGRRTPANTPAQSVQLDVQPLYV